jgi:hypothetical protein
VVSKTKFTRTADKKVHFKELRLEIDILQKMDHQVSETLVWPLRMAVAMGWIVRTHRRVPQTSDCRPITARCYCRPPPQRRGRFGSIFA